MNLWSGGEYDNSLNNIASMEDNQKIMISNQWQSNGETSFLIKRGGGTGYNWTRFRYKTTNAKLKLTIKFKIYSPNAEADIWLYDMYNGNEGAHNGVHIYPSNKIQDITLSFNGSLSNVTEYGLRINLLNDSTWLFIDDICLTSN